MRRETLFVIVLGVMMLWLGDARAATVQWCLTIQTDYQYDWENGEDYILPDNEAGTLTHVPASYMSMLLYRCLDDSCIAADPCFVWDGFLNQFGCTPVFSIDPGTHHFKYFATSKAKGPSNRDLYIFPANNRFYNWPGLEVKEAEIVETIESGDSAPKTENLYFSNHVRHLFGVGVTALKRYTYGWAEGTNILMSADDVNDCGTSTERSPYEEDDYLICVDETNLTKKFIIGHQFGDAYALMADIRHDASYSGSEGTMRKTGINGRCDCDTMYPSPSTRSFCIGSREFTGASQREGYASFMSAMIMNARSSGGGVFMNNYRVMKWSNSHNGTLVYPISEPPWPPPNPYYTPPFKVDLDNDENVKWMEYECNPSGTFQHFGTEWDWADFFWNLWTEGGTSNRWDVSEINAAWFSFFGAGDTPPFVPQIAEICCTTDASGNPASCTKRNRTSSYQCGEGTYSSYPTKFTLGKLWSADSGHGVTEGVVQDAQDMFQAINPSKYQHFLDTGDATGVNH